MERECHLLAQYFEEKLIIEFIRLYKVILKPRSTIFTSLHDILHDNCMTIFTSLNVICMGQFFHAQALRDFRGFRKLV